MADPKGSVKDRQLGWSPGLATSIALWQVSQSLCAPGFSSVKRRVIIIIEIPQRVIVFNVSAF